MGRAAFGWTQCGGRSAIARNPIFIGSRVDDLSPYDRATIGLWSRSYQELSRQPGDGAVVEAAMHAILAGLRRYADAPSLFTAYEAEAAADFALIRSLLPDDFTEETLWRVRDAAFHLRWLELMDSG